LYQTLANIATEKTPTILFPFQKRFCLEKENKEKRERKKDNIGTIIP
jgi:hypothetical protein